jgi:ParB-like chromosome segregation protein Spo0J
LFEQGEVRLKDVLTPHGHDEAEDEVVSSIAESPIGPFNPILVRRIPGDKDGKVELIAGKQRLEAARIREMETIKCQFFTGNDTTARIIRIEEDLFRKESSVLRRAERLVEWAELIQKTGYRISGQVVRKKRGRPPKWLYRRLRELPAIGRTDEARRQTFQRATKMAAISQEAKAVAEAGGLDYNQDALLAIAKAGPSKAVKKAKELVGKLQERVTVWRKVPPPRRGEFVRTLAEELRAAKDDLGRLVTLETGKIVSEGLGEVQEMIDICDFAVGLSRLLYGRTIATERADHRMMETWHPLGVCGVISAFNFPVAVCSWNAALALVCGDPVVWKPSEKTPLTALATQAVVERAMRRFGDAPAGLSAVLIGGSDVGEALVDDARVAVVSATGSTPTGRVRPCAAGNLCADPLRIALFGTR